MKLEKKQVQGLVTLGVALVVFNVIAFAVPFPKNGCFGPTSSTSPIIVPPVPVMGLCSFPRMLTMLVIFLAISSGSPFATPEIWSKLAALTLISLILTSISSSRIGREVSSFHARFGSVSSGSSVL